MKENHISIQPTLEWMEDYLAGKPVPRAVCFEYINWAMDYTGNWMFCDVNSVPFREHFNILKEACEKFIREVKCESGCE